MKKVFVVVMFLLVVTISVISISVIYFNVEILKSNSPPILKTIIFLFNPPVDLYVPLVDANLKGSSSNISFSFINQYNGRHSVSAFWKQKSRTNNYIAINLRSQMNCKVEKKTIFSKTITNALPFIGKDGLGIILFVYKTPQDLPLGKDITCSIDIDERYIKMLSLIRVSKMSDL